MKTKTVCPYDVTYCDNADCPFQDCENHITHTRKFPAGTMVSLANYGGTCRRYIGWLADKIKNGKLGGEQNDGPDSRE